MEATGKSTWLKLLGWPERIFLVLLPLSAGLNYYRPAAVLSQVFWLAAVFTGLWVFLRLVRRMIRRVIWRLRNRLIIAYLFVAAVPILLIFLLSEAAAYIVSGQVAGYLLNNELERRVSVLGRAAYSLARTPPKERLEAVRQGGFLISERFPGLKICLKETDGRTLRFPEGSDLTVPAENPGDIYGIVVRKGHFYVWGHAATSNSEVVVLAPLTRNFLRGLIPHLGDATLTLMGLNRAESQGVSLHPPVAGETVPAAEEGSSFVPRAANMADVTVRWAVPLSVRNWDQPLGERDALLGVLTRISGVLNVVFSAKSERLPTPLLALIAGSIFFLFTQILSIFIGVRMTRTITGAFHDLYEGTVRIREGDLKHRIRIEGNDQLSELGQSFNGMTENLERLLVAEKERQRLQAELEIAREVQSQLHPKPIMGLGSLRIASVCNAARMVSGDYYDYQTIDEGMLAVAIGDVAGKGISAALLMATLQSAMRSQLRQCMEAAAAAGGSDGYAKKVSTAKLVSNLNQQLYASTSPEKYATFFFGVYQEEPGTLTYTNAGHLSPVLIRNGEAIPLDTNGMVVGAFPFARYGESTVKLEKGDLLVCYTDGVTEPENEYGEMFGEPRLIDLLKEHAHREGEEIAEVVVAEVTKWTSMPELQDDMTMLLARKV